MPQETQQQKEARLRLEKKGDDLGPIKPDNVQKSTDRVKLAANIAFATPPALSLIGNFRRATAFNNKVRALQTPFQTDFTTTAVAGMRGDAVNPTILGTKGTNRPFQTLYDAVQDPKVDYGTMRNMSIFNPKRAGQTQEFVKEIKAPLYKDAAREAIMNEARTSSKRGGIGRAFNNARISLGGTGTPAFAPVTPKPGSAPAKSTVPKPSPELQKELNAARRRLREAKSVADVRSVIEDMSRLGKNDFLGMKFGPDVGAAWRRITGNPLTKTALRTAPWLTAVVGPVALAALENAEAKNFAERKKIDMAGAGATGPGGTVVGAPTPAPKSAAVKAALIQAIDDKFDEIGTTVANDASIPSSKIHQNQLRLFNEWLNNSKEHKDAFYADPTTYKRYQAVINPKK